MLSALSLIYPKKPHEVADDLESIVYVLVQMALRFQRHKWTPAVTPGNVTYDDIRKANEVNDQLCSFVSNFFHAQNECVDGYWSGGDEKRLVLEGTSLPVKLDPGDDGEPTALHQLVADLYDLLRRHYAAINYDDLERFKVPPKAQPKPADPADGENGANSRNKRQVPANPTKTIDPLARVKTRRAKARDQNAAPAPAQPQAGPSKPVLVQPLNDHITTNPLGRAQRVLDTHEEMLKAFERILYVDEAKTIARDLSKYKDDKWYDQFDGLKSTYNASDKNPSGQHRGRSAEKRKAVAEVNQALLRLELRHKRPRGETWRTGHDVQPLATVVEVAEPNAAQSKEGEEA